MDKKIIIMGATAGLMSLSNSTYAVPVNVDNTESIVAEASLYNAPIKYVSENDRLSEKLALIACLEDNWDSQGAIAPLYQTLENTKLVLQNLADKYLKLLDIDDIAPSPYGTVNLYFEDEKGNELNIEFGNQLMAMSGEIEGEEILMDDLPIYEFNVAVEEVTKLFPTI